MITIRTGFPETAEDSFGGELSKRTTCGRINEGSLACLVPGMAMILRADLDASVREVESSVDLVDSAKSRPRRRAAGTPPHVRRSHPRLLHQAIDRGLYVRPGVNPDRS